MIINKVRKNLDVRFKKKASANVQNKRNMRDPDGTDFFSSLVMIDFCRFKNCA